MSRDILVAKVKESEFAFYNDCLVSIFINNYLDKSVLSAITRFLLHLRDTSQWDSLLSPFRPVITTAEASEICEHHSENFSAN